MNASKMKNMVILKDLPSNIVEEAYVVLKTNQKFKNKAEKNDDTKTEIMSDYVVKEAEMVVSNYLSGIENNKKIRNLELKKLEEKYKKLRKFTIILIGILILNMLSLFYGQV